MTKTEQETPAAVAATEPTPHAIGIPSWLQGVEEAERDAVHGIVKEQFPETVPDDVIVTASWLMRRLQRLAESGQTIMNRKEAEHALVHDAYERQLAPVHKEEYHLRLALDALALAAGFENSRVKSAKTPYGVIGVRKSKARVIVRDIAALRAAILEEGIEGLFKEQEPYVPSVSHAAVQKKVLETGVPLAGTEILPATVQPYAKVFGAPSISELLDGESDDA